MLGTPELVHEAGVRVLLGTASHGLTGAERCGSIVALVVKVGSVVSVTTTKTGDAFLLVRVGRAVVVV